jgi:hypothetical protein
MANLGIALGAGAGGFERGYGLGQDIRADRKKRKQDKELRSIDATGKTQFDADVASGKTTADQWDGYYSRYVVPRKANALLEQGNLDEAERYRKWAEDDSVRQGSRLFAAGMIKGQAGDMKGAITDFVEAGKIKGYAGDYEIGEVEQTDNGFRVILKDAQGNEFPQEFTSADEILRFGATYLNPDAAYDDWKASQAAATEFETDIAKTRAEKDIDFEYDVRKKAAGIGGKAAERDTLDYRKQAADELKDLPAYQDAAPEDQQRMIEERVRLITGEAAPASAAQPPPRQAIVDTQTGQVVDAPLGNAARKADRMPMNRPEVAGIGIPRPRPRPQR